jgi:hypothetical protein
MNKPRFRLESIEDVLDLGGQGRNPYDRFGESTVVVSDFLPHGFLGSFIESLPVSRR